MAPPLTAWQLAGKAYFYVATWMSISMAVILFNKVRRVPREEICVAKTRTDICRVAPARDRRSRPRASPRRGFPIARRDVPLRRRPRDASVVVVVVFASRSTRGVV
jgi:hypothetical protein